MRSLKFREHMIDINRLLKRWQHRKLALPEKVTVIVLPKLIHFLHLTSIPNLCQYMLNEIHRLFFIFIRVERTEKNQIRCTDCR